MQATIVAKELRRIINATRKFIGLDINCHARPAHKYIKLDFSKEFNTVTACAADGYRLSIEHAVCGTVDEDFSAYITPDMPKYKTGDTAIVSISDSYCYIHINDSVTGYKQPNGDFLDYESYEKTLKEKPVTFKIGFNGDYLLAALQSAQASCGNTFKKPVVLEFKSNLDPVVIRTNSNDMKIVLPLRLKSE